jgi:hypothetical protein
MWRAAATESRVEGFAGQSLAVRHILYLYLGFKANGRSESWDNHEAEEDQPAPEK